MGLDIHVYKPVKKEKSLIINYDYDVLEKNSPLFIFKEFIFKKKTEYLNIEKTFKKGGLKIEDYDWCMQSGLEKSVKTDDIFSLIDEDTILRHGKENCIVIIGVEEDILYKGEISNNYLEFHNETNGKRLIVINPLIDNKIKNCICTKDVGYQRKGANKQFYDDGMWDSDEVISLEWAAVVTNNPKLASKEVKDKCIKFYRQAIKMLEEE